MAVEVWRDALSADCYAIACRVIDASMISQMKALEDENRRLKKMYAENAVARHGVSIALAYCPAYFVGGEHIAAVPYLVRNPARGGCAVGVPPAHLGMRLVHVKPSH